MTNSFSYGHVYLQYLNTTLKPILYIKFHIHSNKTPHDLWSPHPDKASTPEPQYLAQVKFNSQSVQHSAVLQLFNLKRKIRPVLPPPAAP